MKNYISNYEHFDRINAYDGELGVICSDDKTIFRIWAPFCTAVTLRLYTAGEGNNLIQTLSMERAASGVWQVELLHTCYGMYYTYMLEYDHSQLVETIDIYARACGINGERGYIADFKSLDPEDWDKIKKPVCQNPVDAVIYECHVRDFSIDGSAGIPNDQWQKQGRFEGFTVEGTRFSGTVRTVRTCLDHLKELGITHVQLMPVADYATVNEKKPYSGQYNWGYDPKNYMCLEGYYCSDPDDADVRIREFKNLVAALHKAGIGVILDVVYNHTYFTQKSAFHKTVPYYYHRLNSDGKFSNGSGCGNETASERVMFRKFMLDALSFWVNEYHIDGFRFDLMGLHDISTMNMLRHELDKIDPNIIMYGEGWTGGDSPYPTDKLCFKWNSYEFGEIGLFNDNIRDGIKGSTFDLYDRGYVSGNDRAVNSIKRGITGNTRYKALRGTADDQCWSYTPAQAINYCEAHDNHTLWDKLCISMSDSPECDRIAMDKLAAAIVLLSQGVPFLQLGQDFLRTKPKTPPEGETRLECCYEGNSYNSPDSVNKIRWDRKAEHYDVFLYYKALIALRKSSPLFRMRESDDLDRHLYIHNCSDIVCYELVDEKECYFIALNNRNEEREVRLPNGVFYRRLDENGRPDYHRVGGSARVPRLSCAVFKRLYC